jgi:hypothetical protein
MMTSFLPSFFLAVRAGNREQREGQKGQVLPADGRRRRPRTELCSDNVSCRIRPLPAPGQAVDSLQNDPPSRPRGRKVSQMSGLYDQQQPPPPHPVYNPPGVQSGSAPGADRMGSNPTAVAADGLASPSGGGPSPFSHPGQPLQPANEHAHSIVHSLYGSGGPSGPGGGGYYASNNTAMAAANYGTAPMHSSPGFPPIDHAGHAMLPPMHAQPPPPPSSSSSRRSLGSGEYPQQPPAADARFQRGLAHSAGPSYLAAQQHPQSHPRVPTPAAAAYPLASAIGANSVSTTNSALDGTGSQSLDTSPSQQHATTPSTPSGGGTNSQETTKSRSAMACQLCR